LHPSRSSSRALPSASLACRFVAAPFPAAAPHSTRKLLRPWIFPCNNNRVLTASESPSTTRIPFESIHARLRGSHRPQWLPHSRPSPSFPTVMSVSTASPSRLRRRASSGASSSMSSASVSCFLSDDASAASNGHCRSDRSRQVDAHQHHLRVAPDGQQGSLPARRGATHHDHHSPRLAHH
jgi:hypothetical protein